MLAQQIGFKSYKNKSKSLLISYFNSYDREYDENGIIDNYEGSTSGLKYDYSKILDQYLSLGFGFDYKYDWGEFENRGSYSASSKGNSENLAFFGNLGFNLFNDSNISLFLRNDNHEQTGNNNTYKIDLSKKFKNLTFGLARMTGLRNPTIYELYGTDNFGYSGNKDLNPEKSVTNEVYSNLFLNNKTIISLRGFRTNIKNNIEYKSNRYVNDAGDLDLVQNGVENQINYKSQDLNFSLFTSLLSSKKKNNEDQLRRPEKSYGINISKKIKNNFFSDVDLNISYKHYGKHFDTHSTNFSTIQMDSTDIINVNIVKNMGNYDFYLRVQNLLDENFQRPHGYNHDGRIFKIGIEY